MTKDEEARRRRAARRAKAQAALNHEIARREQAAREAGFQSGRVSGASDMRHQVLEHSAKLYKLGQDTEANAVREVYRKLSSTHLSTVTTTNEEPRRG